MAASGYATWTVKELRAKLREKRLKVSGKKSELVARLEEVAKDKRLLQEEQKALAGDGAEFVALGRAGVEELPADGVQQWAAAVLKHNGCDDEHIVEVVSAFKKQGVNGKALVLMTAEELVAVGSRFGPAKLLVGRLVAPAVLDQLAVCMVKLAREQYGKYLDDVHTTLRDRKEALRVLAEAAVQSVEAAASKPRHLVVFAGPSGSGKTRGGYEGSAMWDHADGQAALEEALKGKPEDVVSSLCGLRASGRAAGANVLTFYIDLNNGLPYHSDIDKLDADVRLGARLAARALGLVLGEVVHVPQQQLLVRNVLSAILRGQLERRTSNAPLLLVVHIDEWQLYLAELLVRQLVDIPAGIAVVKSMLSALNSFAFDPPAELKGKFVLLPILSGTPVLGGVSWELTERMQRIDVDLPPLSEAGSVDLAAEMFVKQKFDDSEVREMLKSTPARLGLSDTGYFPRLLVRMCSHAATNAAHNRDSGDAWPLASIKWAECAQEAERYLPPKVDYRLPVLALAGMAIEVTDKEGQPVMEGMAPAVRDADQRGLVRLQPAPGALLGKQEIVIVVVPLMLLRRWCSGRDFDPELLRPVEGAWTWEDFERLYAHFTAARLRALLYGTAERVVMLQEVLTGSRGAAPLLTKRLRIRGERRVLFEENKFMVKRADKPLKTTRVLARPTQEAPAAQVSLLEGVFLATAGNALIDMRLSLEMEHPREMEHRKRQLHVFVQDKHTGDPDENVTINAIVEWYDSADAATENWRSDGDETALVYFTNRELTDPDGLSAAFFESRPRLLVVTRTELSDALTPALAGRALIPQNPRPA